MRELTLAVVVGIPLTLALIALNGWLARVDMKRGK